jgi:hypothetical protein
LARAEGIVNGMIESYEARVRLAAVAVGAAAETVSEMCGPAVALDALSSVLLRLLLELGPERAREALRLLGERVEASDVG